MAEGDYQPLWKDNIRSVTDWQLSYVYNDPDFLSTVAHIKELQKRPNTKPERIDEFIQQLAKKYRIKVGDINLAMLPIYVENRRRRTATGYDAKTGRWSISFEENITKEELIEEWSQFERWRAIIRPRQKTKSRRRPPENPALLYAMFKARQRGETFIKIFEQYYDGKLPGYSGPNDRFQGGESLEAYYYKYYPAKKP